MTVAVVAVVVVTIQPDGRLENEKKRVGAVVVRAEIMKHNASVMITVHSQKIIAGSGTIIVIIVMIDKMVEIIAMRLKDIKSADDDRVAILKVNENEMIVGDRERSTAVIVVTAKREVLWKAPSFRTYV